MKFDIGLLFTAVQIRQIYKWYKYNLITKKTANTVVSIHSLWSNILFIYILGTYKNMVICVVGT